MNSTATIGDDGVSLGPVQAGSVRYNDMRRQLDNLKDELLQSETSREDLRLKSQQQEDQLQILQQRIDELNVGVKVVNFDFMIPNFELDRKHWFCFLYEHQFQNLTPKQKPNFLNKTL